MYDKDDSQQKIYDHLEKACFYDLCDTVLIGEVCRESLFPTPMVVRTMQQKRSRYIQKVSIKAFAVVIARTVPRRCEKSHAHKVIHLYFGKYSNRSTNLTNKSLGPIVQEEATKPFTSRTWSNINADFTLFRKRTRYIEPDYSYGCFIVGCYRNANVKVSIRIFKRPIKPRVMVFP